MEILQEEPLWLFLWEDKKKKGNIFLQGLNIILCHGLKDDWEIKKNK